jgi:hypothetical protein
VIKREFMIFFLLFAVADEAAAAALREVGLAGRWPLLQVPSGPELLVGLRVPRNQAMTAPMVGTAAPNAVAPNRDRPLLPGNRLARIRESVGRHHDGFGGAERIAD